MARIISKGDTISIYSRASTLQGFLSDGKRSEPQRLAGWLKILQWVVRYMIGQCSSLTYMFFFFFCTRIFTDDSHCSLDDNNCAGLCFVFVFYVKLISLSYWNWIPCDNPVTLIYWWDVQFASYAASWWLTHAWVRRRAQKILTGLLLVSGMPS